MKKTAAVAALVLAFAVSGCSAATPSAPTAAGNSRAAYVGEPSSEQMLDAIRKGWTGNDQPDAAWVETATMLVCKQIIGGIEPRVTTDPANNELVVSVAEWGLCEVDR